MTNENDVNTSQKETPQNNPDGNQITTTTFSKPKNFTEEFQNGDSSDEEFIPRNARKKNVDSDQSIESSARDSIFTLSSDEDDSSLSIRTSSKETDSARSESTNAKERSILRNDKQGGIPLGFIEKKKATEQEEDKQIKKEFLGWLDTKQKTALLKASHDPYEYDEHGDTLDHPEYVAVGTLLKEYFDEFFNKENKFASEGIERRDRAYQQSFPNGKSVATIIFGNKTKGNYDYWALSHAESAAAREIVMHAANLDRKLTSPTKEKDNLYIGETPSFALQRIQAYAKTLLPWAKNSENIGEIAYLTSNIPEVKEGLEKAFTLAYTNKDADRLAYLVTINNDNKKSFINGGFLSSLLKAGLLEDKLDELSDNFKTTFASALNSNDAEKLVYLITLDNSLIAKNTNFLQISDLVRALETGCLEANHLIEIASIFTEENRDEIRDKVLIKLALKDITEIDGEFSQPPIILEAIARLNNKGTHFGEGELLEVVESGNYQALAILADKETLEDLRREVKNNRQTDEKNSKSFTCIENALKRHAPKKKPQPPKGPPPLSYTTKNDLPTSTTAVNQIPEETGSQFGRRSGDVIEGDNTDAEVRKSPGDNSTNTEETHSERLKNLFNSSQSDSESEVSPNKEQRQEEQGKEMAPGDNSHIEIEYDDNNVRDMTPQKSADNIKSSSKPPIPNQNTLANNNGSDSEYFLGTDSFVQGAGSLHVESFTGSAHGTPQQPRNTLGNNNPQDNNLQNNQIGEDAFNTPQVEKEKRETARKKREVTEAFAGSDIDQGDTNDQITGLNNSISADHDDAISIRMGGDDLTKTYTSGSPRSEHSVQSQTPLSRAASVGQSRSFSKSNSDSNKLNDDDGNSSNDGNGVRELFPEGDDSLIQDDHPSVSSESSMEHLEPKSYEKLFAELLKGGNKTSFVNEQEGRYFVDKSNTFGGIGKTAIYNLKYQSGAGEEYSDAPEKELLKVVAHPKNPTKITLNGIKIKSEPTTSLNKEKPKPPQRKTTDSKVSIANSESSLSNNDELAQPQDNRTNKPLENKKGSGVFTSLRKMLSSSSFISARTSTPQMHTTDEEESFQSDANDEALSYLQAAYLAQTHSKLLEAASTGTGEEVNKLLKNYSEKRKDFAIYDQLDLNAIRKAANQNEDNLESIIQALQAEMSNNKRLYLLSEESQSNISGSPRDRSGERHASNFQLGDDLEGGLEGPGLNYNASFETLVPDLSYQDLFNILLPEGQKKLELPNLTVKQKPYASGGGSRYTIKSQSTDGKKLPLLVVDKDMIGGSLKIHVDGKHINKNRNLPKLPSRIGSAPITLESNQEDNRQVDPRALKKLRIAYDAKVEAELLASITGEGEVTNTIITNYLENKAKFNIKTEETFDLSNAFITASTLGNESAVKKIYNMSIAGRSITPVIPEALNSYVAQEGLHVSLEHELTASSIEKNAVVSALTAAAKAGHVGVVQVLIGETPTSGSPTKEEKEHNLETHELRINKDSKLLTTEDLIPALIAAAQEEQVEVIQILAAKDKNLRHQKGFKDAFVSAAINKDNEVVEALFEASLEQNAENGKITSSIESEKFLEALNGAVYHEDNQDISADDSPKLETLNLLLSHVLISGDKTSNKNKVEIETETEDLSKILTLASQRGDINAVKGLYKASIYKKPKESGKKTGDTSLNQEQLNISLEAAINAGSEKTVEFLLSKAQEDSKSKEKGTVGYAHSENFNDLQTCLNQSLINSAQHGNPKIAEKIFAKSIKPDGISPVPSIIEPRALFQALKTSCFNGHADTAKYLLSDDVLVTGDDKSATSSKLWVDETALNEAVGHSFVWAASGNHEEILAELSKKKSSLTLAGLNAENGLGSLLPEQQSTILLSAATHGVNQIITPLVTQYPNVQIDRTNVDGNTPLHLCVLDQSEDLTQGSELPEHFVILLDKNADILAENNNGDSPIISAMRTGMTNLANKMIAAQLSREGIDESEKAVLKEIHNALETEKAAQEYLTEHDADKKETVEKDTSAVKAAKNAIEGRSALDRASSNAPTLTDRQKKLVAEDKTLRDSRLAASEDMQSLLADLMNGEKKLEIANYTVTKTDALWEVEEKTGKHSKIRQFRVNSDETLDIHFPADKGTIKIDETNTHLIQSSVSSLYVTQQEAKLLEASVSLEETKDILKLYKENKARFGIRKNISLNLNDSLTSACENGHLDVVKELYKASLNHAAPFIFEKEIIREASLKAIENQHVNVCLFLNEKYPSLDLLSDAIVKASENGNLGDVGALYNASTQKEESSITQDVISESLGKAAGAGHEDVANFLSNIADGSVINPEGTAGLTTSESASLLVKNFSQQASLRYSNSKNFEASLENISKNTLIPAARNNHAGVINSLISKYPGLQNKEGFKQAFIVAAENGNDAIVETLFAASFTENSGVKSSSLEQEHLVSALTAAVENGHSQTAEFLLNKSEAANTAQVSENQEVIPVAPDALETLVNDLYVKAAKQGNAQTISALHARSVRSSITSENPDQTSIISAATLQEALREAAKEGHENIIESSLGNVGEGNGFIEVNEAELNETIGVSFTLAAVNENRDVVSELAKRKQTLTLSEESFTAENGLNDLTEDQQSAALLAAATVGVNQIAASLVAKYPDLSVDEELLLVSKQANSENVGHIEVVRTLAPKSTLLVDNKGNNALHNCILNQDEIGQEEETPAHIAALLERGATLSENSPPIFTANNDGDSALISALRKTEDKDRKTNLAKKMLDKASELHPNDEKVKEAKKCLKSEEAIDAYVAAHDEEKARLQEEARIKALKDGKYKAALKDDSQNSLNIAKSLIDILLDGKEELITNETTYKVTHSKKNFKSNEKYKIKTTSSSGDETLTGKLEIKSDGTAIYSDKPSKKDPKNLEKEVLNSSKLSSFKNTLAPIYIAKKQDELLAAAGKDAQDVDKVLNDFNAQKAKFGIGLTQVLDLNKALIAAATVGNIEAVRKLHETSALETAPAPFSAESFKEALAKAQENGHINVVAFLFAKSKEKNIEDLDLGNEILPAALIISSASGEVEDVKTLYNLSLEEDGTSSVEKATILKALEESAKAGHREVTEVLLGQTATRETSDGKAEILVSTIHDLSADELLSTLKVAIAANKIEIIEALIEKDPELRQKDEFKAAFVNAAKIGNTEDLKRLYTISIPEGGVSSIEKSKVLEALKETSAAGHKDVADILLGNKPVRPGADGDLEITLDLGELTEAELKPSFDAAVTNTDANNSTLTQRSRITASLIGKSGNLRNQGNFKEFFVKAATSGRRDASKALIEASFGADNSSSIEKERFLGALTGLASNYSADQVQTLSDLISYVSIGSDANRKFNISAEELTGILKSAAEVNNPEVLKTILDASFTRDESGNATSTSALSTKQLSEIIKISAEKGHALNLTALLDHIASPTAQNGKVTFTAEEFANILNESLSQVSKHNGNLSLVRDIVERSFTKGEDGVANSDCVITADNLLACIQNASSRADNSKTLEYLLGKAQRSDLEEKDFGKVNVNAETLNKVMAESFILAAKSDIENKNETLEILTANERAKSLKLPESYFETEGNDIEEGKRNEVLLLSSVHGADNITQSLVSKYPDLNLNVSDEHGNTALHHCVKYQVSQDDIAEHGEIPAPIKNLIQEGGSLLAENKEGESPIFTAIKEGRTHLAEEMILKSQSRSEITSQDKKKLNDPLIAARSPAAREDYLARHDKRMKLESVKTQRASLHAQVQNIKDSNVISIGTSSTREGKSLKTIDKSTASRAAELFSIITDNSIDPNNAVIPDPLHPTDKNKSYHVTKGHTAAGGDLFKITQNGKEVVKFIISSSATQYATVKVAKFSLNGEKTETELSEENIDVLSNALRPVYLNDCHNDLLDSMEYGSDSSFLLGVLKNYKENKAKFGIALRENLNLDKAFIAASTKGNLDVAKLLYRESFDLAEQEHKISEDALNEALQEASKAGSTDAVKLILGNISANKDPVITNDNLELFVTKRTPFTTDQLSAPLATACRVGDKEVFDLLMDESEGSKFENTKFSEETLSKALVEASRHGRLEITKSLLGKLSLKADTSKGEVQISEKDLSKTLSDAFIYASANGFSDVAETLATRLDSENLDPEVSAELLATLEKAGKKRLTNTLHEASKTNLSKIAVSLVKILAGKSLSVDEKDKEDKTALYHCVENIEGGDLNDSDNLPADIDALILNGADIFTNCISDSAESSPLQCALKTKPILAQRMLERAQEVSKEAAKQFKRDLPLTQKSNFDNAHDAVSRINPASTHLQISQDRIERLKNLKLAKAEVAKESHIRPSSVRGSTASEIELKKIKKAANKPIKDEISKCFTALESGNKPVLLTQDDLEKQEFTATHAEAGVISSESYKIKTGNDEDKKKFIIAKNGEITLSQTKNGKKTSTILDDENAPELIRETLREAFIAKTQDDLLRAASSEAENVEEVLETYEANKRHFIILNDENLNLKDAYMVALANGKQTAVDFFEKEPHFLNQSEILKELGPKYLPLAAKLGNTDLITDILESGKLTQVNEKDAEGNTALYCLAAQEQDSALSIAAEAIVNKNSDSLFTQCENGNTAIHKAIDSGNYEIAKKLLEKAVHEGQTNRLGDDAANDAYKIVNSNGKSVCDLVNDIEDQGQKTVLKAIIFDKSKVLPPKPKALLRNEDKVIRNLDLSKNTTHKSFKNSVITGKCDLGDLSKLTFTNCTFDENCSLTGELNVSQVKAVNFDGCKLHPDFLDKLGSKKDLFKKALSLKNVQNDGYCNTKTAQELVSDFLSQDRGKPSGSPTGVSQADAVRPFAEEQKLPPAGGRGNT